MGKRLVLLCSLALGLCANAFAQAIGTPFFYVYPPWLEADRPFALLMGRAGNPGTLPPLAATRIYVTEVTATGGVTRAFDGVREGTNGSLVRYVLRLPAGTYDIWYLDSLRPDYEAPPTATARIAVTGEGFVRVVEFVNAASGHFFITADEEEIRRLDDGRTPGWTRTGLGFKALPGAQRLDGTVNVCRLYGLPSANLDTHFFSDNPYECAYAVATWRERWILETDSAFGLPPDYGCDSVGDQPIYRLYNRRPDVNHRYTTSPAVRDAMLADGWILEARAGDRWACTVE